MNFCSLFEMLYVTRQVSEPSHESTDLTELVLKFWMLFTLCAEWSGVEWSVVDLHTDFRLMQEGLCCCLSDP
ncbi:unnamed protein product, partial [Heterobilharzia americana]